MLAPLLVRQQSANRIEAWQISHDASRRTSGSCVIRNFKSKERSAPLSLRASEAVHLVNTDCREPITSSHTFNRPLMCKIKSANISHPSHYLRQSQPRKEGHSILYTRRLPSPSPCSHSPSLAHSHARHQLLTDAHARTDVGG